MNFIPNNIYFYCPHIKDIKMTIFSLRLMDIQYPKTRKLDIKEDFHGTEIADPYRWLETHEGDEIQNWIDEQNKLVDNYIDQDIRKEYHQRLTDLYNYTRYSPPTVVAGKFYYTKNTGLQPQPLYYVKDGVDGEETEFFDPNTLSEDGTIAVMAMDFTEDGKLVVISLSTHGSDWNELRIMNVETKEFLDDHLVNIRNGANVDWLKDNSGFYYSAYVGKEDTNSATKLWFHKIGEKQSNDELIYEHSDDHLLGVYGNLYQDEKYLFIGMSKSTMPRNMLYFKNIKDNGELIKLVDELEFGYTILTVKDDFAYIRTNDNADNAKIIKIDLNNYTKDNWIDVIPEIDEPIPSMYQLGLAIADGKILISYIKDVKSEVHIYDLDGTLLKKVKLPDMGTAHVIGKYKQKEIFIGFTNFFQPYSIYLYDFDSNSMREFFPRVSKTDPSNFVIKQVFYASKDGTKVPMYIMHKKDIKPDGNTPTYLYGYGGFNISLLPMYSSRAIAFMEKGGVYAQANMRGGGEYGKKWHFGGILDKKQNVFDDFQAAAEWLIDNGYTSSKKLAIMGRSNGGLLTAACVLQRPELYGAVIVGVGVLDMLRYHKYSIGRYWIPEYGDPDKKE